MRRQLIVLAVQLTAPEPMVDQTAADPAEVWHPAVGPSRVAALLRPKPPSKFKVNTHWRKPPSHSSSDLESRHHSALSQRTLDVDVACPPLMMCRVPALLHQRVQPGPRGSHPRLACNVRWLTSAICARGELVRRAKASLAGTADAPSLTARTPEYSSQFLPPHRPITMRARHFSPTSSVGVWDSIFAREEPPFLRIVFAYA